MSIDIQQEVVESIGGAWTNREDGNLYLYLTSLPNPAYLVVDSDGNIYRIKYGEPFTEDRKISVKEAKRIVNLNSVDPEGFVKRLE